MRFKETIVEKFGVYIGMIIFFFQVPSLHVSHVIYEVQLTRADAPTNHRQWAHTNEPTHTNLVFQSWKELWSFWMCHEYIHMRGPDADDSAIDWKVTAQLQVQPVLRKAF